MAKIEFFDVLVDQIIQDVRAEFHQIQTKTAEASPLIVHDTLSGLLDYRLRQSRELQNDSDSYRSQSHLQLLSLHTESAHQGNHHRNHQENEKSQRALKLGLKIEALSDTPVISPGFDSSAAELSFALVSRLGAQFYLRDFLKTPHGGHTMTPEAFRRERRRVLLSLHPDRYPQADAQKTHKTFLEAADAFDQLAKSVVKEQTPHQEAG